MDRMEKNNTLSLFAMAATIRARANGHLTAALARRGITDILPAHGSVLHALFQQSPIPMSVLAETIGRKKNTVTSLVGTLEERGYCRREASPQDARVQLVWLTDKGKALYPLQAEIPQALLDKAWAGVPESEKTACIRTLQRILDNLRLDDAD